jgi:hypothetical protein
MKNNLEKEDAILAILRAEVDDYKESGNLNEYIFYLRGVWGATRMFKEIFENNLPTNKWDSEIESLIDELEDKEWK